MPSQAFMLRSRPMRVGDLNRVMEIEELSYSSPWPRSAFANELQRNSLAHYMAVLLGDELIGYSGYWLILDEAHITNIAVHPDHRRRGAGEWTLNRLIDEARDLGAGWITLEVRPSNPAALALYAKYGFKRMGLRKEYYADNKEDAVIMWSPHLDSDEFLRVLAVNRAALFAKERR